MYIFCALLFQSGLINIMCGYGAQEFPVSYMKYSKVYIGPDIMMIVSYWYHIPSSPYS